MRAPTRRPPALASLALLSASVLLAHCDRSGPANTHSTHPAPARADSDAGSGLPGASDPAEARALSAAVAQALGGLFRQAGGAAQVDGATVRAAGHVVSARAEVAEARQQPDHTVAALEVWLDLDGVAQPAFHVVAVGIDANRAEAAQHAVREWTVQYGMPTVDALRSLGHAGNDAEADAGPSAREPREPLPVGVYLAFPGPTGVRGETPASWDSGAMQDEFWRRLGSSAPGDVLPPPNPEGHGFHAVHVTAHVRNGQVGEANCRIDGRESERLCRLVRELPWPGGDADFILRQYAVLAPARGQ